MELIRIGESKLKVMLSEADLRHYELSNSSLDYQNTDTRRALWSILDVAYKKTGFDAAKERVAVEVYPAADGGCEMFVTKLFGGDAASRRLSSGEKKIGIYVFLSLESLLLSCRRLIDAGYADESEVYGIGDAYCLLLREKRSDALLPENSIGEYRFLAEYGHEIRERLFPYYIREHGKRIGGDNAVKTLASLR